MGTGSTQQDGLVTSEGVQEGSDVSTAEGPGTGGDSDARGPQAPDVGGPAAAPPVDMESEQSRQARAESGPGQQLAAGEG